VHSLCVRCLRRSVPFDAVMGGTDATMCAGKPQHTQRSRWDCAHVRIAKPDVGAAQGRAAGVVWCFNFALWAMWACG